jgi:hypothetical protein
MRLHPTRTRAQSSLGHDKMARDDALRRADEAYKIFDRNRVRAAAAGVHGFSFRHIVMPAPQVDPLDISEDGKAAWKQATAAYFKLTEDVEKEVHPISSASLSARALPVLTPIARAACGCARAQLAQKIGELLSAAKNDSNEMFRICGRFMNLFNRPLIEARLAGPATGVLPDE